MRHSALKVLYASEVSHVSAFHAWRVLRLALASEKQRREECLWKLVELQAKGAPQLKRQAAFVCASLFKASWWEVKQQDAAKKLFFHSTSSLDVVAALVVEM